MLVKAGKYVQLIIIAAVVVGLIFAFVRYSNTDRALSAPDAPVLTMTEDELIATWGHPSYRFEKGDQSSYISDMVYDHVFYYRSINKLVYISPEDRVVFVAEKEDR